MPHQTERLPPHKNTHTFPSVVRSVLLLCHTDDEYDGTSNTDDADNDADDVNDSSGPNAAAAAANEDDDDGDDASTKSFSKRLYGMDDVD